jgi:membrane protein YqaA with SNARE-associated domain
LSNRNTTAHSPAEGIYGADRIAPKRWLAAYALYIIAMVVVTVLVPARFRVLTIGVTYLSLATTLIPLNVTAGVLFMASGQAMPGLVKWLLGSQELRDRIFGSAPANLPDPLVVALLATLATVVANLADYHAIAWLMRWGKARKLARTKFYERIETWFGQAPFLIILLINALAVPFGADRLLAAPRGYSRAKFALAVFLGRLPRYYVVALVGRVLDFSWWQIILVCVFIALLVLGISKVKRLIVREKTSAALAAKTKAAVAPIVREGET